MSALSKGMEIPTSGELLVIITPNGEVKFKRSVASTWDKTTAIPVPPHGRLWDLDELEKDFRENAKKQWNMKARPLDWADAFEEIAGIVADVPTIIEAEEET